MPCICSHVPAKRRMEVLSEKGARLASFHQDCPEHGVKIVSVRYRALQPVRQWFTRQEMIANVVKLRRLEGLKLVTVTEDQQNALLEWLVWEPAEGSASAA